MLVSVIIPCYNYGNFLQEAVISVLKQTYNKWECLIVNDGSTDNTEEVARGLVNMDSRIVYLPKDNGGLSSARNYGIANSKGDLISFLDADDLLDREKLHYQVEYLLNNPDFDIVYGQAKFFEKNDLTVLYSDKLRNSADYNYVVNGSGNKVLNYLVKDNFTVVSSPLVRKSVFLKVGLFDITYKSYEDWHFWLRCALMGCSVGYCDKPEISTYIRFGHESMMTDKRKMALASVQLRKYLQKELPARLRWYNFYRLIRSWIKLMFIS